MITKRMDGTADAWDRDRLAVGFGFVYHPRLSRRLRIGSPCLPEVRDIDSLALAWNTRCGSLGAATGGYSMKASHLPFDPGWEVCDIRYTCEHPFQRACL